MSKYKAKSIYLYLENLYLENFIYLNRVNHNIFDRNSNVYLRMIYTKHFRYAKKVAEMPSNFQISTTVRLLLNININVQLT